MDIPTGRTQRAAPSMPRVRAERTAVLAKRSIEIGVDISDTSKLIGGHPGRVRKRGCSGFPAAKRYLRFRRADNYHRRRGVRRAQCCSPPICGSDRCRRLTCLAWDDGEGDRTGCSWPRRLALGAPSRVVRPAGGNDRVHEGRAVALQPTEAVRRSATASGDRGVATR